MSDVERYIQLSAAVPGWCRGERAWGLSLASFLCPPGATIVEIGTFLGSSSILLAGPRKLRGSGRVHVVDPFDGSGDEFSVPHYIDILNAVDESGEIGLRAQFENHIRHAGLIDWIEVHEKRAAEGAAQWNAPIDLLFLDGDQSLGGARQAYDCWAPFLKPGAVIALHNSGPGDIREGHDGHRRLVVEELVAPRYVDVRLIAPSLTLARKV
jgi:MMP 1-O-methyltransferase